MNKQWSIIARVTGVFLLVGITLLMSCTAATKKTTNATPTELPKPEVANIAPALEQDILEAVNRYRKSKGLSPLQMNFVISAEARKHSVNMATKRVPFGHQGLSTRIKTITGKITGIREVSENVAVGSMSAQQVVSGWLQSTGHRQNIEGSYTITGIGVARNQKSQLYFTQLFAR